MEPKSTNTRRNGTAAGLKHGPASDDMRAAGRPEMGRAGAQPPGSTPSDGGGMAPLARAFSSKVALIKQQARERGFNSAAAFIDTVAPPLAGTLADGLVHAAAASVDHDLVEAAEMIVRARRFEVPADVIDSIEAAPTDIAELLRHVDQLPPSPQEPWWIEYRPRDTAVAVAAGPDAQASLPERLGYLIFRDRAGLLVLRRASYSFGQATLYPCAASMQSDGITVKSTRSDLSAYQFELLTRQMALMAQEVLHLLAITETGTRH